MFKIIRIIFSKILICISHYEASLAMIYVYLRYCTVIVLYTMYVC